MCAILDEQSKIRVQQLQGQKVVHHHTHSRCVVLTETAGRTARGYVVESFDEKMSLRLPTLIECNQVPNNHSVRHHSHLRRIADEIPPLDSDADILLFLGRVVLRVHKVRNEINGPDDAPFAQKLDLDWVFVGDVCLRGARKPSQVSSFKTSILENGRPTYFSPCNSQVRVKEKLSYGAPQKILDEPNLQHNSLTLTGENLGQPIFCRTASIQTLHLRLTPQDSFRSRTTRSAKTTPPAGSHPFPFRNPDDGCQTIWSMLTVVSPHSIVL